MFYDTGNFDWVKQLEHHHRKIRNEVIQLQQSNYTHWHERNLYDGIWDVFGFRAFGTDMLGNCAQCPNTAELVRAIPDMTTAGFSCMGPGAHIKPHRGYTNQVLRCHLGLVIPPDCALRVGRETRQWEEGRCLVFDDTIKHEAWNRSDAYRIVLLIDFLRPKGS